jgi:hypothetical protein
VQRQGPTRDNTTPRVNPTPRLRATGVALLVAHLTLVAWLTLRPLDVPWVSPANLRPFAGIRADLALPPAEAARRIAAGLALLAPLGVLLPAVHARLHASPLASLTRTVAAGALLSLAIELAQTGIPGQVVDVDCLLLNTTGVALAHLAVVPAARALLRRRAEGGYDAALPGEEPAPEPSQGRTPTIPRVEVAP